MPETMKLAIRKEPEDRCKHSQRDILAARLRLYGYVSTYDAIYSWRCPMDGNLRRNTRLAANVFELRRDGWVITTEEKPGQLASYRLVGEPVKATHWVDTHEPESDEAPD